MIGVYIGICLLYFFTKPKEQVFLTDSKIDSDSKQDLQKDSALDSAFAKEGATHHIKGPLTQNTKKSL